MHSKSEIVKAIRSAAVDSCFKRIWLFGSVQREEHDDSSDIDLVVEYLDDLGSRIISKLGRFEISIEKELGQSVQIEYVSLKTIENSDLRIHKRIMSSKELIYESN